MTQDDLDPESLEAEDPLHDDETVLSASTGRNTIVDHDPEPLEDDDWALEEEQIVDEDELNEDFEENQGT